MIAFSGQTIASIITRTETTFPAILRLREWELDRDKGRYRRTRGRSQLVQALGREPTRTELERQHATSALKAIGLHWPRKPSERHKVWADRLMDLGLKVDVTQELGRIRHRALSTKMQEQLAMKWQ